MEEVDEGICSDYLFAVVFGSTVLALTTLEVLWLLTSNRTSDKFSAKNLLPFLLLFLPEKSSADFFIVSSSHKRLLEIHSGARTVYEVVS